MREQSQWGQILVMERRNLIFGEIKAADLPSLIAHQPKRSMKNWTRPESELISRRDPTNTGAKFYDGSFCRDGKKKAYGLPAGEEKALRRTSGTQ